MVQKEELEELFEYRDGDLYGKYVPWRRKESNSRVVGKKLGSDSGGYLQVNFTYSGKKYRKLVHRIIYAMHHNYWPDLVDHIDQDPSNNRVENLRAADKRINAINSGLAKNNKSGIKGVSWDKNAKKWSAQIKANGSKVHLGVFSSLEEAKIAREAAEKVYWHDLR